MEIRGTSALVTGGASGLGLASVRRLLDFGASVVILDLPSESARVTADDLGDRVRFAPADVTDEDSVGTALDIAESFGPLRILVHCAGRGGDRLRILDKERKAARLNTFNEEGRSNIPG